MIEGPSLPRSIRWRLQMGLLDLPTSHDTSLCDQNYRNVHLQRDKYCELVAQHEPQFIESKRELEMGKRTPRASTEAAPESVDPLTAAVQQLEAIEEQDKVTIEAAERAHLMHVAARHRRKGAVDEISHSSTERLAVIQKDIARLNTEHAHYYHDRLNQQCRQNGSQTQELSESFKARNISLMEILHTYANQYDTYHQGMHEICSYIMLVIEIDLVESESSSMKSFSGLLNNEYLLHDTYIMFEALMAPLGKCYEESASVSNSVVAKIPYVALDKVLYTHIQAVPMSHEVYCAKWIRLMFSREIRSWRNVLCLWDVIFDLTTKEPSVVSMNISQYSHPDEIAPLTLGMWKLDEVLETVAASLIWLKRDELLLQNAENVIEILVGCQALDDVTPLIDTLMCSLHRMHTSSYMAPLRLPSEKKPQKRRIIRWSLDMVNNDQSTQQPTNQSFRTHDTSLTMHRNVSLQNLLDCGTSISRLITDSCEDGDDQDENDNDDIYTNSDDDTYSCAGSRDTQVVDVGNDVGISAYNNCSTSPRDLLSPKRNNKQRVVVRSILDFIGFGTRTTTPKAQSVELRARGGSACDSVDEEAYSLGGDDQESSIAGVIETTNHIEQNDLTEPVDVDMAYCIGYSMAF